MLVPEIARRQHGVFTRSQARDAGFTAYVVANRLRDGVWAEVVRNAFTLAGVPRTTEVGAMAAVLVTGGVASHATAAQLHRFGDVSAERRAGSVEVTTVRRIHAEIEGVFAHRHRLHPGDITAVRGIRATTRSRTVLDLMAAAPRGDAARIMFRALQQGWLTRADLDAASIGRRGMHGIPMTRELAALAGTNAHSVAESRLHELLRSAAPDLSWQANVALRLAGGQRVVVDVLVGDRLVVEVDGVGFHSSSEAFHRDRDRQNALVQAGFTVLRYTWIDLVERPERVVAEIMREARRLAA